MYHDTILSKVVKPVNTPCFIKHGVVNGHNYLYGYIITKVRLLLRMVLMFGVSKAIHTIGSKKIHAAVDN